VLGATRPIAAFVDDLSNWYIRLSRRRFWDGDRDAFNTMHHVLVTVSQLLAPTTPFIAEELYQNLAAGRQHGLPDSVHLSQWPNADTALINEELSAGMASVQKVTSLGHAARQSANLKVRQPLAQVIVRPRQSDEQAGLERLQQLVLDELNVKALAFADGAGDLVDVEIFPLPKQLGQKYGKGYPVIRKLVAGMDQMALATQFQAGESVELNTNDTTYLLEPGDVEIRSTPRSGYSVAEDGGYLVAITTELTPELAQEGQARELVRNIQQLRKDAGLEISDRIDLTISDSSEMASLLENFGSYIKEETLALAVLQVDTVQAELAQVSFKMSGNEVTVGLNKASA